jgi:hypothetical protein
MAAESETRSCPYCKEEIKADAIKCKHCGSRVTPEKPSHGGTCPYCKEEIHPEAITCKHCRSDLRNAKTDDCGCGSAAQRLSSQLMIPEGRPSSVGSALQGGGGQPFRPYVGRAAPVRPEEAVGGGVVMATSDRSCGDWQGRFAVMGISDVVCTWAERDCCEAVLWCRPPPDSRCKWEIKCCPEISGFSCQRGFRW